MLSTILVVSLGQGTAALFAGKERNESRATNHPLTRTDRSAVGTDCHIPGRVILHKKDIQYVVLKKALIGQSAPLLKARIAKL